MDKFPWAKYAFSIFIAAAVSALVAKLITGHLLVLALVAIGAFLISVKGFKALKDYR